MLCRVHRGERVVELILIGLVTKEVAYTEWTNLFDRLRAEHVLGYHLLVDLTRADSNIVFAEMADIVQFIRQDPIGFDKIGIFCETPLNYGTSRMFQSLYREKQNDIKVSSSRETLISWMMGYHYKSSR
jgi:hypothetical protein